MERERLRRRIEEWMTMPIEGHGLYNRYEDAREMLGEVLAALPDEPAPTEPHSLPETDVHPKTRRHMEHYRSCGCLDDSAECCDPTCCDPSTEPEEGK